MLIPKTFSVASSAIAPAIEDALAYGVWLMLVADDANREHYSYDENDAGAGHRIVLSRVAMDRDDQRISVPQQIVAIAFPSVAFERATSSGGRKLVTISVMHLEAYRTDYDAVDEDAVGLRTSAMAVLTHVEEILMRGTLYQDGQTTNRGQVVNPYTATLYTVLDAPDVDMVGAYNPTSGVPLLNDQAPVITRVAPDFWPRRAIQQGDKINPARDLAVAYGVLARYEVDVMDRETMTSGGRLG